MARSSLELLSATITFQITSRGISTFASDASGIEQLGDSATDGNGCFHGLRLNKKVLRNVLSSYRKSCEPRKVESNYLAEAVHHDKLGDRKAFRS